MEEPTDFNEFYWWAFSQLISERGVGMSVGPIPYSAVSRFADDHHIRGYERYVFHYCIHAMDNVHLKLMQERSEKEAEKKRRNEASLAKVRAAARPR